MFNVSLIFSLVLISTVACTQWDPFKFDFHLICRHYDKPTYWYSVQFLENDVFFSGEWITQKYEERFAPGIIKRTFLGAMDGDEIGSSGYSVIAIFQHDCTKNGERTEVQFAFRNLCEIGRPCHMKYDADLTDHHGRIVGVYAATY